MLTGGFSPCLPSWPIKEVKPQGKIDGYDTDDLIVFVENSQTGEVRKLIGQVKHSIKITISDTIFGEVIQAAWNDFNNSAIFTRSKDVIALITGPISGTDQVNVQWLLHHAKYTKNSDEFYRDVKQANFRPSHAEKKLSVFKHHLKIANGHELSDEEIYQFFKHFYILGYDVGGETGVILPLLHSHISQFQLDNPKMVWGRIVDVVQTWNQHGCTLTRENLPEELIETFKIKSKVIEMPKELKSVKTLESTNLAQYSGSAELALINLSCA